MFEWLIALSFQYVIFVSVKKIMFTKLSLNKNKWMMPEIVDKNVFKIMTLLNNLVLICSFEDHNLVFCSFCRIHVFC